MYVKTLDANGAETASYCWITWGGEGDEEYWTDGDNPGEKVTGITFGAGEALWIQGSSDGQGLQSSGQVSTKDVTIQLQNGATLVGNSFPVSVALEDILPTGDDLSDNVYIKTLDATGVETASYCWITWGGEGDEEYWTDGDNPGDKITGITFNAGQGLWVQGSSDSQFITIPGVEL